MTNTENSNVEYGLLGSSVITSGSNVGVMTTTASILQKLQSEIIYTAGNWGVPNNNLTTSGMQTWTSFPVSYTTVPAPSVYPIYSPFINPVFINPVESPEVAELKEQQKLLLQELEELRKEKNQKLANEQAQRKIEEEKQSKIVKAIRFED